jgi:hypothetical protein
MLLIWCGDSQIQLERPKQPWHDSDIDNAHRKQIMTSQEMMRATAKPGYWFVNVANVDEPQNWQEQIQPYDSGDTIFGYDRKEFMARQYK